MDFKKLQTFQTVANLGTLGKASDKLRIAQPALSRQIRLLEHDLKAELFLRNGRGMQLTEAGELLLERIGPLLKGLADIRGDVQSFNRSPSGHVVMGLVPTVSCILAARFARNVAAKLPDVSLRIVESYGGHLTEWLHRGEMDISIVYGPAVDLHLNVEVLGREELVLVLPANAVVEDQVSFDWLARQDLVLPSFSHGLRALVEKAMDRKNLHPRVKIEADSYKVLISMVEMGLGYTILPASAVQPEVKSRTLKLARLEAPSIRRELVLATPKDRIHSVATSETIRLLKEEVEGMISSGEWELDPPI